MAKKIIIVVKPIIELVITREKEEIKRRSNAATLGHIESNLSAEHTRGIGNSVSSLNADLEIMNNLCN